VHRDIKPSNLILTSDDTLFLIDFNSAKESEENKSKDTILIGTEGYAAPEQYGFSVSKPTTDIYAIGILLNELLTSYLPDQVEYKGYLQPIIKKCRQMDPIHRYQTVDQLQQALPTVKKKQLQSWLPPGFRNNILWVKIMASFGYLLVIGMSL